MDNSYCSNYNICKLVHEVGFTSDEDQRKRFIAEYCQTNETKWSTCKRFIAKNILNFCPDFVLPDTPLSTREIIDKFDEQSLKQK
jgi:hypothetical protein